jgi:cytosine/adenosine deaminase-related metal-dependent hydrolase
MSTILIGNGRVLTGAPPARLEAVDLRVEGGCVAAIGPAGSLTAGPEAESIDAAGHIVIPGLIDAHTHSYTSLLHGTVAGEPLDLFVLGAMAHRAPADPRSAYVAAQLHALDLLRHGITAHVDHFRHGALPTLAAVEAAFAAYRDIGIRATVAPMYEDLVYLDSLPIDRAALPEAVARRWAEMRKPPPEAYFELLEALLPWRGAHGRLDLLMGVDGPQRCTPRLLDMAGVFGERHGIGLHTHLLEAKTQLMMAPVEHGCSLVRVLDRFGLVNPRSSLAHFVWCTDDDIEIAAARGAHVVHNPLSNLLLGSGLQPTARLLRAGINVALGTDSDSGNGVSLLEQARFAALLSRISEVDDRRWLGAADTFRLATTGGAALFGMAGALGAVAVGARADLVLIDACGLDYRPMGDVFNHLVMYESGANVRTVLVEGEVVLRDGRATRIDEAALLEEAESWATVAAAASRETLAQAAAERPAFHLLLIEALQRPVAIQRFARLS